MSILSPTPGLADQFAAILDGLCRVAAARMARPRNARERASLPLLMLLWTRLRRMAARFASLTRRAAAGRQSPRPIAKAARTRSGRPPDRLPRGVGWLVATLGSEAACYGQLLQHLMAQPEFSGLLDTVPQAGRMLRPLCRMLALPAPPASPATVTRAEAVETAAEPPTVPRTARLLAVWLRPDRANQAA